MWSRGQSPRLHLCVAIHKGSCHSSCYTRKEVMPLCALSLCHSSTSIQDMGLVPVLMLFSWGLGTEPKTTLLLGLFQDFGRWQEPLPSATRMGKSKQLGDYLSLRRHCLWLAVYRLYTASVPLLLANVNRLRGISIKYPI